MKKLMTFLMICAPSVMSAQAQQVERPPQFVSLAFDGSKSANMWEQTTTFAKQNNIKFTYFVSGVYFVDNSRRSTYQPPKRSAGRSDIGFGGTHEDIKSRNAWVEYAISQGHEIAGHANGHFDGSSWSQNDWINELGQFQLFMFEAPALYGGVSNLDYWDSAMGNTSFGFRAPLLAHNRHLFPALKLSGYKYDTSKVQRMDYWPTKDANGIWDFALAGIRMSRSGKSTLSMDYNLYYAQSKGKKGNPANFKAWEDEVFETYINYFRHNYYGNRAPVDIGHHFSLWNNGIYWNAMKRFAQAVCHLPEVVCGTYQDLLAFMENKSSNELAAFQNKSFPTMQKHAALPAIVQFVSNKPAELSPQELKELNKQVCPAEAHNEEESFSDLKIAPDIILEI